ncbi:hypothetical protein LTR72_011610 [Exophiala xenobiotica]|nr:hypothetical protein LTR72_011610 [Exophiala xenobiotica]KAK5284854.1 hypothetical protein LTR14_011442 [Exophiala xenobiotica]KAK5469006.1 hypothetical protein LTR55_011462 [Exophiala xenobiotica]
MTKNLPDERLVYLPLKDSFKAADAQIRKAKKVREVVRRRNIISIALNGLPQKQKQRDWKPTPRSASGGQNNDAPAGDSHDIHLFSGKATRADLSESRISPRKRPFLNTKVEVPSLYPVYLPYRTQHRLLLKVQGIHENACYNFGSREMKDIMAKKGWDCPECVELNVWARTFLTNQGCFQPVDLEGLGQSFSELTSSISHLRHAVVHRLRISAEGLERFLVDAEALTQLLHDDHSTMSLARLRRDTQMSIEELKRNKDLLESRLNSKLKQISDQRIELDRLEQSIVDEMLKADKEYHLLAGSNLDEAIQSYDTAIHSTAPTETETEMRSESDFTMNHNLLDLIVCEGDASHRELKYFQV